MRAPTSFPALALGVAMVLSACASPTEPTQDLIAQLTANGRASFALAVLDDPQNLEDQRGAWIRRDDIACNAEGNPSQALIADTVVLHRDGRAERVYRIEYAELGLSFRSVYTGTWASFTPENWFHYSDGPSIRLVLETAGVPSELFFRVDATSEISTHTLLGTGSCPSNAIAGHSVRRSAFLRYERF